MTVSRGQSRGKRRKRKCNKIEKRAGENGIKENASGIRNNLEKLSAVTFQFSIPRRILQMNLRNYFRILWISGHRLRLAIV